MDHKLVTTAFTIDGYKISKNLGIVRGIVVRSRSLLGTIGASFQTILGGNITLWSELCEKTRIESYEIMINHAEELGANSIIGFRYDANEVAQGVTEVLAYGTAVVVDKINS
ncbi:MAG: YbjQ family protein [Ignavibacteriaceae bacterium]|nr:YbjQ family protein [Ignavibacteriaceae bacterium]